MADYERLITPNERKKIEIALNLDYLLVNYANDAAYILLGSEPIKGDFNNPINFRRIAGKLKKNKVVISEKDPERPSRNSAVDKLVAICDSLVKPKP